MLMKRIIGLLALCGCLAMPAAALAAPVRKAPTQAIVEPLGLVRVALTTSLGTIVLELDGKRAPITTANFLRYVDQRRLDGTVFYRTMRLDFGGPGPQGLIQGGTQ